MTAERGAQQHLPIVVEDRSVEPSRRRPPRPPVSYIGPERSSRDVQWSVVELKQETLLTWRRPVDSGRIDSLERRLEVLEGSVADSQRSRSRTVVPRFSEAVELAAAYTLLEPDEVLGVVGGREHLLEKLIAMAPKLRSCFDSGHLTLSVSDSNIVVGVDTALDVATGESRYRSFLREWWFLHVEGADGLVLALNYE